jgi:hypothetical protein
MDIRIFNRIRDKDYQLTKNFKAKEFFCKCGICRDQYIDLDHVKKLQKIRDEMGIPITITSGYRCEVWNKSVGGAVNSRHRKGDAADIKVNGKTPAEVADKCEFFDGLGRYDTFTHTDSRGYKARWDNSTSTKPKLDTQTKDYLPDGPTEEEINITLEDIENLIF